MFRTDLSQHWCQSSHSVSGMMYGAWSLDGIHHLVSTRNNKRLALAFGTNEALGSLWTGRMGRDGYDGSNDPFELGLGWRTMMMRCWIMPPFFNMLDAAQVGLRESGHKVPNVEILVLYLGSRGDNKQVRTCTSVTFVSIVQYSTNEMKQGEL